jgi:hypothetical protein
MGPVQKRTDQDLYSPVMEVPKGEVQQMKSPLAFLAQPVRQRVKLGLVIFWRLATIQAIQSAVDLRVQWRNL